MRSSSAAFASARSSKDPQPLAHRAGVVVGRRKAARGQSRPGVCSSRTGPSQDGVGMGRARASVPLPGCRGSPLVDARGVDGGGVDAMGPSMGRQKRPPCPCQRKSRKWSSPGETTPMAGGSPLSPLPGTGCRTPGAGRRATALPPPHDIPPNSPSRPGGVTSRIGRFEAGSAGHVPDGPAPFLDRLEAEPSREERAVELARRLRSASLQEPCQVVQARPDGLFDGGGSGGTAGRNATGASERGLLLANRELPVLQRFLPRACSTWRSPAPAAAASQGVASSKK